MSNTINLLLQKRIKVTPKNQEMLGEISRIVTNGYKESNVVKVLNNGKENIVIDYKDTYIKKPELTIAIQPVDIKNIDGDKFYNEEITLNHDYVSLAGKDKFSFAHERIGKEREKGNYFLETLITQIAKFLQIGEH